MNRVIIVVIGLLILFVPSCLFTVDETEQAIITMFGDPVGDPISEPGLKFKLPFVHTVTRFEKRWLPWDGDANQITGRLT